MQFHGSRRPLTGGILLVLLAVTGCATGPMVSVNRTAGDLKGMVYDLDRQPVSDAALTIEGTSFVATSDLHGRFGFGAVPFGTHTLRVAKAGYEPLSWTFRFSDPTAVVYLQPASFDQLVSQAANCLERQDWAAYQDYAERARAVDSKSLTLTILEATALERQGRPQEALTLLEAVSATRKIFTIERFLGDLNSALGRRSEALIHWKDALGLQDDPGLRKRIAGE